MKPAEVRDLLYGLLAGWQAEDGTGIEAATVIGDHRLVVTFSDHTRAVVTIGMYQVQTGGHEEHGERVQI